MYTKHFGLKILPFENVPDPMFFFDHGDHARARNRITNSLKAGRGLVVVTGPIGSGKTTLSQMIVSDFSNDTKIIWMAEPPGNGTELFLFIAQELGLRPSTSARVFMLRDIKIALLRINSNGSKCIVIIDESHLMPDDAINGIRILNNLEIGSMKLIQILLLGQEEFMETLKRPEMEPFKQRIATMEIIGKMDADRTRKYISHRIQVAGGNSGIFTDTGWEALDAAFNSGSTPRTINSLCDRSFNAAFERKKTMVDVDDVHEGSEGMEIQKRVFYYKIALKQMETEKQDLLSSENDFVKKPEAPDKTPVHPFSKESDETDVENENRQTETSQSTQEGFKIGSFISKKGLKIPILFLLLSIATLISSMFFYYQRSAPLTQ